MFTCSEDVELGWKQFRMNFSPLVLPALLAFKSVVLLPFPRLPFFL